MLLASDCQSRRQAPANHRRDVPLWLPRSENGAENARFKARLALKLREFRD